MNQKNKASELLRQSADPFDKACMIVLELENKVEKLETAAKSYLEFYDLCQKNDEYNKHHGSTETNRLAVMFSFALGLEPIMPPIEGIKMKAELNPDGSLEIEGEGIYESLALDAWYDKFFKHLNVYNTTPDGMERPLLRIILKKDNKQSNGEI